MLALFAIPSLEEKLQTLAKGRGEGRGGEALDSLPPKIKKEKAENKEKEEKKNRAKKDLKTPNQKRKEHGGQNTS